MDKLWIDGPDGIADAPAPKRSRVGTDPSRHIGCPLWWFRLVFPIVRGKNELAVALYIYRLRMVRHSLTLTITNERLLAELGVDRFAKYRTLRRLAGAKVISLRQRGRHLRSGLGKAGSVQKRNVRQAVPCAYVHIPMCVRATHCSVRAHQSYSIDSRLFSYSYLLYKEAVVSGWDGEGG